MINIVIRVVDGQVMHFSVCDSIIPSYSSDEYKTLVDYLILLKLALTNYDTSLNCITSS